MEKKNVANNVHRSVSLPPDWWEAIELAAYGKGGISISKWIALAVKEALPEGIMLTTKNGRGRPRLNETKRPRAKPKVVKTDWRKTCNLCRRNPKPEGGKICEDCQGTVKKPLTLEQSDFCNCDSFADCVCGSHQKFIDWQTTTPE